MSNRFGIPNITSTGIEVTTTKVTYNFDDSRALPFAGIVLARILQPIPTASASLPVYFGNVPLMNYNNEQVIGSDLAGTGIVQVYYNSNSKLLQLMTGYADN